MSLTFLGEMAAACGRGMGTCASAPHAQERASVCVAVAAIGACVQGWAGAAPGCLPVGAGTETCACPYRHARSSGQGGMAGAEAEEVWAAGAAWLVEGATSALAESQSSPWVQKIRFSIYDDEQLKETGHF